MNTSNEVFNVNSPVFIALGLAVGACLFGRPSYLGTHRRGHEPELPATAAAAATPTTGVTIIIPARNEAATLPLLLADLADGVEPGWRIIVVDDHSTDDTSAIVSVSPHVGLVTAGPLPAHWRGKQWACWTGALQADTDDTLIFLDADVRVGPKGLRTLLEEQQRFGGVLSVQPYHRVPTAVEQLSGLFNLVSIMGINASSSRPHGMFGPVLCCQAATYFAVDGHRGVRHEIVDDVALAQLFRTHHLPVRIRLGGGLIQFRMYGAGFRQMWEGWTKNVALGARSVPLYRALGVAWWLASLVSCVFEWRALPTLTAAAVGSLWLMLRRVGSYPVWTALLFPFLLGFFLAVFVYSIWMTAVRRQVTWKGRTLSIISGSTSTPPRSSP